MKGGHQHTRSEVRPVPPFEFIQKIRTYDAAYPLDEELICKAYALAFDVHGAQKRDSGEPYIHHPVAVASILMDMHLDASSIITALLHDTLEDTDLTTQDIQKDFGETVARLVNGVSKLSQLEMQPRIVQQAENFRKLVLAMSTDIRVLLVKLADRLHNMRTLSHVKSLERRRRIANETMEIYAPLADRMGLQWMKDELENHAFHHLNPDVCESITKRLQFLHASSENMIDSVLKDIQSLLKESNIEGEISGRIKTPYSIWCKMQRKHIAFEQLSDIMAFRVIVKDVGTCYQLLGVLHNRYRVVPGRFKDYISTPKMNQYQSLHTGLIGPMHNRIEVQIRSQHMHDIAEMGIAAHWSYKDETNRHDGRQYAWLRRILEILDHTEGAEEFLEHTKLEMFQDQVFCFTPKGELISLPKGATTIDFAYAIHSNIGDHTVGAKINGRVVPLRTQLHNGDQVDVITSSKQSPSPTWERFAVTGRARACIRRFIRSKERDQFIELGRSILSKTFRKARVPLREAALEAILHHWKLDTLDDLFVMIGEGRLHKSREVLEILSPTQPPHKTEDEMPTVLEPAVNESVSIEGLVPGMAIHYASCCHPIRGDSIVGVVITGRGVVLHTRDCEQLKSMDSTALMDLDWGKNNGELQTARVRVTFINKKGTMAQLTNIIFHHDGNILNFKITHRSEEFWEVIVDIEVRSTQHLQSILAGIRSLPIITRAFRE